MKYYETETSTTFTSKERMFKYIRYKMCKIFAVLKFTEML